MEWYHLIGARGFNFYFSRYYTLEKMGKQLCNQKLSFDLGTVNFWNWKNSEDIRGFTWMSLNPDWSLSMFLFMAHCSLVHSWCLRYMSTAHFPWKKPESLFYFCCQRAQISSISPTIFRSHPYICCDLSLFETPIDTCTVFSWHMARGQTKTTLDKWEWSR